MKNIFIILLLGTSLSGCANSVQKIQTFSANYQAAIVAINADIAATAPLIAKGCGDLQSFAMLIAPFIPNNAKAPQYFAAANGALDAYCTAIPMNISGTAKAVTDAVIAARNGYYNVRNGK